MRWEYNLQSSGNHDEAFCSSVPGLNSMGEQGWELVTVILADHTHAKSGSLWWVYKRPKMDDNDLRRLEESTRSVRAAALHFQG
jgi:hypothetical protein